MPERRWVGSSGSTAHTHLASSGTAAPAAAAPGEPSLHAPRQSCRERRHVRAGDPFTASLTGTPQHPRSATSCINSFTTSTTTRVDWSPFYCGLFPKSCPSFIMFLIYCNFLSIYIYIYFFFRATETPRATTVHVQKHASRKA